MSHKTKIEWCDATWNPVTGCTPVSDGCEHCYAERMHRRFRLHWGITLHEDRLDIPLHWRRPRRIFVCSMSDLFHPKVPDSFRIQVWNRFIRAPQHTYLVLTKRPDEMHRFLRDEPVRPNVWLGITAENQQRVNERWPFLAATPAIIRFVSCEPMLGPIDLSPSVVANVSPDWVICGAETGPCARPLSLEWVRDLRAWCKEQRVPFFLKKLTRHGGRELDGTMSEEFPV